MTGESCSPRLMGDGRDVGVGVRGGVGGIMDVLAFFCVGRGLGGPQIIAPDVFLT